MIEDSLPGQSANPAVSERKRLLVVDDDPVVHELVANLLKADGWDTSAVVRGREALALLERQPFDLVLLDLRLPDIDGFEVLRLARQSSSTPVIALSGMHGIEGRQRFLEMGGDDYITKPFSEDRLRFRTRAVLMKRRELAAKLSAAPKEPPARHIFSDGYLTVDLEGRRVMVAGQEKALTLKEYDVLHELLMSDGKPVTREYLLKKVWGPQYAEDSNLLYLSIYRLRKKIERHHAHPQYILTIPWLGYRFGVASQYRSDPPPPDYHI